MKKIVCFIVLLLVVALQHNNMFAQKKESAKEKKNIDKQKHKITTPIKKIADKKVEKTGGELKKKNDKKKKKKEKPLETKKKKIVPIEKKKIDKINKKISTVEKKKNEFSAKKNNKKEIAINNKIQQNKAPSNKKIKKTVALVASSVLLATNEVQSTTTAIDSNVQIVEKAAPIIIEKNKNHDTTAKSKTAIKKTQLDSLKKENQKRVALIKERNKFVTDSLREDRLQRALRARAAKDNGQTTSVSKKEDAFLNKFRDNATTEKKPKPEKQNSLLNKIKKITNTQNIVATSDDILNDFNNEDYEKIAAEAPAYITQNPLDTNIIIKTGISNIINQQFNNGFAYIDKVISNKDSLIKFYSVLPYINENIKIGNTYEALIAHIDSISPNSLWTNFSKAVFYNTRDSNAKAEIFAEKMYAQITSKEEFNTMSYIYPSVLFDNGKQAQAITVLKQSIAQYPTAYNAQFTLFQMYKKQKMDVEAYSTISNLILNQPENDDYYQEKIDLCIAMKRQDEACEMLHKVNTNGEYDTKVCTSKCANEFTTIEKKEKYIYQWELNKDGKIDTISASVAFHADSTTTVNYVFATKVTHHQYTINSSKNTLDTSRSVFLVLDAKTKTDTLPSTQNVIWLSKKVFAEIKKDGETMLNIGNGYGIFKIVKESADNVDDNKFTERININNTQNKFVETLHLFNSETYEQIWVLDNEKNPMVVKQDTAGSTLQLKKVNFQ